MCRWGIGFIEVENKGIDVEYTPPRVKMCQQQGGFSMTVMIRLTLCNANLEKVTAQKADFVDEP